MATPIYDWFGKRSYAQSGEDIIAWGEISGGHGGPPLRGFYVDVGAYHPKLFSNTYLFYKKGWRGVCVEPNPTMAKIYKIARPRDVLVNCGIAGGMTPPLKGNGKKTMEYFEFENSAANTFSVEQAEKNQKVGRKLISKKQIKIKTLKEILDEYVPKGQKIDLLSVDVEGMDEEVLRSSDWRKYRPRVIICEDLEFDLDDLYRFRVKPGMTGKRSGVVGFLERKGYKLVAKTPYSLIFKRNE